MKATILRLALAVLLVGSLPMRVFGDTLSISAWSGGDALNATNLNSRMSSITTWSTNIANDNIKSTAAIAGSKLDLTSSTGRISHSTSVTSDAPVFTSGQTWNNVAAVFSMWRGTATNTNSASTSRLFDMRVGSTIIASLSRVGQLILAPQDYASGPTTLMEGAWFNLASATMTDNMTAASGTAPRFMAYAFQRPALAAANSSVTTTHAATVFIASAPVTSTNMTLTNRYALWVDQGDVRIGGTVFASGSATINGRLSVGTGGTSDGQAYIKSLTSAIIGLVVDTDANPVANSMTIRVAGTDYVNFSQTATANKITIAPVNLGNNVAGPSLVIGRNTSAGAVGQSGATVLFTEADGGDSFVWADATGVLRINSAAPTGSSGAPTVSDTAGTIVGSQSSYWRLKQNIALATSYQDALQTVLSTPLFSFDMDGRHRQFGLVIYDKDAGSWYSQNDNLAINQVPALDERNLFGHLIAAIKTLNMRIVVLEQAALARPVIHDGRHREYGTLGPEAGLLHLGGP